MYAKLEEILQSGNKEKINMDLSCVTILFPGDY